MKSLSLFGSKRGLASSLMAGGSLLAAVPVIAVAVGFLLVWHFAVQIFEIAPILLPSPAQVAVAGWENRQTLLEATWVSGRAAAAGFATSVVVGSLVAILFSQSRHIRNAFYPYVIFLQTVPIIAIAPLLITWFGYTFATVVYITVIISLFPIISNMTAGLIVVDRDLEDLFRIYGAGRLRTMLKLRLPSSIPYLVLGMRISSGLAVIGAIIGDFFIGSGAEYDGLGTLMTGWGALQKTDRLIAALGAATLLGIVFFGAVNLLATTLLGRWSGVRRRNR